MGNYLMMLLVSALASAPPALGPARETDRIEIARRALPPEVARRIADWEMVEAPSPGGQGAARLFTAARAAGPGICLRDSYHVTFTPEGPDSEARASVGLPGAQVALAAECSHLSNRSFAWVQPPSAEAGAIAALRKLHEAQRLTRAGKSPAAIACTSQIGSEACAEGAAAVLASLPLDRIFIIEPREDGAWQFAVMPSGPGTLYWEVRLSSAGGRPGIGMTWRAPAPF